MEIFRELRALHLVSIPKAKFLLFAVIIYAIRLPSSQAIRRLQRCAKNSWLCSGDFSKTNAGNAKPTICAPSGEIHRAGLCAGESPTPVDKPSLNGAIVNAGFGLPLVACLQILARKPMGGSDHYDFHGENGISG